MKLWRITRVPIALALVVAGAAVALFPQLTEWRYAQAQQAMADEVVAATADLPVVRVAADEGGVPMPHGAVARVVASSIGLDAYVVEGVEKAQLNKAVGHYPETPLPGEPGNAALAGHRTMFGHPFRHLDKLQRGDTVETWTAKRHAVYRVVSIKRVDPTEVGVIAPTSGMQVTLTTCNPVGSARERLIVSAELVGP